jgi:ribosomal protein L4
MQIKVHNLEAKEVGTIELADSIFGLPSRTDILARVID